MFIHGGYYEDENYNCVYHETPFELDLKKEFWISIEIKGFIPRFGHCSFPFKNYLFIFSGEDKDDNYLNDI